MTLEQKIEAILFWKGEPVTYKSLAADLKTDEASIKEAIEILEKSLTGRGVTLVRHDGQVMLGTAPEMSRFFEDLRREELQKDLSKAALETLSIILYRDGVTRGEINFIRGVNSAFILRMLEIRGLVEKTTHKSDARMYVYRPSLELLGFMGVSNAAELPRFEEVRETLENKLLGQENNAEDK